MKYAVLQKYYDNGRINAHVIPVNDDFQETVEFRKGYDFYIDVFDTRDEAEQFKADTLNA